jgi:two-component system, cell cycle sensor histidine kinase and response regulator CckA
LGSGTAFKIYLPPAERTDHATVRVGPPAEIHSGGETILVAEDEEAVRKLVVTVLRSKGYKVIEARDAEHALELWRQYSGKINLLLTDTIMPRMDGPDLSQKLKVTNPDIKVIYMSGYTDDAIVLRELLGSGASFLQKPFGPEALILKVSETLNAT